MLASLWNNGNSHTAGRGINWHNHFREALGSIYQSGIFASPMTLNCILKRRWKEWINRSFFKINSCKISLKDNITTFNERTTSYDYYSIIPNDDVSLINNRAG